MKILFFANTDWYLYNFRRALIKRVRQDGYDVVLVSPEGEYADRLMELGYKWYRLPMRRRSLNPFKEVSVIYKLGIIYLREKPDIVHHFTLKCAIYGMIASYWGRVQGSVNALTGLGYVFTGRGLATKVLRYIVQVVLILVFRHRNTHVIVQNWDDYNLLKTSKAVNMEYLHLIKGSGVDTNRFRPEKINDDDEVRVLLATRLLRDKGVFEFFEAAKRITANDSRAVFLVAGEPDKGNPSAISSTDIENWLTNESIRLLGHVDDILPILASCDIVVLPSYREGLPRILLEAGACGLPLVTTDVPGCREVVQDGVNGFLVPPRNIELLVCAIEKLIESKELRQQMGAAAREVTVTTFDQEIVIAQTLDVYKAIS